MIHHGDALSVLKTMRAGSVQTCVTSPPYWNLRDYGVKGQLGLEATPDAYVARLVEVFREVRRVLKDDGTLWVNLGDSYAGSCMTGGTKSINGEGKKLRTMFKPGNQAKNGGVSNPNGVGAVPGLAAKNLVGIPWRVAFALQADGWILRSDIIWHKPNPMPESVRDRPTKAHEYVFLLAKRAKYFYDADAIAEPLVSDAKAIARAKTLPRGGNAYSYAALRRDHASSGGFIGKDQKTRNRRTVWTITPRPFKGAHFATFPPALVEPCVLAGSRPGDTVLDPFSGAGTTVMVAESLGRVGVGIELNAAYIAMSETRLKAAA